MFHVAFASLSAPKPQARVFSNQTTLGEHAGDPVLAHVVLYCFRLEEDYSTIYKSFDRLKKVGYRLAGNVPDPPPA